MSSGESLSRHSLLVVLQLNFFKKKIRASTHKRVRRELGGDHRLDVAVRRVQPAEEIEDLARLGDGVTDVAKRVGELLEASAVLADRHVALMKGTELSFDVDRALEFVVTKETFDVVPDEVRRGTRLVDDVKHILGDGVVDPVHDAVVEHVPLGVAVIQRWRRAHMSLEAEFAEDRVEGAAPLAVVGFSDVKENRYMRPDVDSLNNSSGGRLRSVDGEIAGRAGGVARRGHGERRERMWKRKIRIGR